jgi:hypothetical protein
MDSNNGKMIIIEKIYPIPIRGFFIKYLFIEIVIYNM